MALDLLNGCLVDGDLEQQKRERKVRRRSLAISVSLQAIALAAVLLMPLLGKPAAISWNVVPVPPYYSRPTPVHVVDTQIMRRTRTMARGWYDLTHIPQQIINNTQPPEPPSDDDPFQGAGINVPGATSFAGTRGTSQPPPPVVTQTKTPKVVHLSQIDASKLISRVEPIYPVLAKQIGRSGKVELHAIIGEDGTIQSLEAVGGDPMFFASAMQAVKQWRYTPTMLNGQPVKVDTYIAVIYNMTR
jgi:periplasmic protein TonB